RAENSKYAMCAARVPTAVSAVGDELRFERCGCHRLLATAAKMSLACLARFAVLERDANMAGEAARVRICGIDDVAHLARERAHLRVVHHCFFVFDKARVATQHSNRDGIGNAELGGIAVGRILLRSERLPEA